MDSIFEGKLWIIASPLPSLVEKNQSVMWLMGENKKKYIL